MKKIIILTISIMVVTLLVEHFLFVPLSHGDIGLHGLLIWLGANQQIFETISSLSGPCIALIGAIGLWQLKLTKDSSKMNSKRQSFQIANERCDHFQNDIMSFANSLDKKIKDLKITFFDDCKIEWELGKYKDIKFPDRENCQEEIQPIFSDVISLLNKMDSFAAFFTSGVADESLAFSIQGKAFCEILKPYFPVILFCCVEKDDCDEIHLAAINGYEHLIVLFTTWNQRLEKYRLNQKINDFKKQAMEKQKKFSDEAEKIEDRRIKSIGT